MGVCCKWGCVANGGVLQMGVCCKWGCVANGGVLQMGVNTSSL